MFPTFQTYDGDRPGLNLEPNEQDLEAAVEAVQDMITAGERISKGQMPDLLVLLESVQISPVEEKDINDYATWYSGLVEDDGIMGGETCFPGTRITVKRVGGMANRGETPIMIRLDYPMISEQDIKYAQRFVNMGGKPT